jgi:hypothetical protein
MDAYQPSIRHIRYVAGLDVGQMADPSALTVLERDLFTRSGLAQSRYDARWLERFPLQTPYPTMARLVRERLERLGERAVLVIDVTGVGRGIVDLFRQEWMGYDASTGERLVVPGKPAIVAVTLVTSALRQETSPAWDEAHVAKRDVVMAFMVALQQRRFRAAQALKEAALLFKEGQHFQWKVSHAGNDQYGAWRAGQHDDLLLAVAMAVWWGEQHQFLPLASFGQTQSYATPAGSPHAPRLGAHRPQMAQGGWGGRR